MFTKTRTNISKKLASPVMENSTWNIWSTVWFRSKWGELYLVGLHCLILTVTWDQDGGAGRVVDPLGRPSSLLHITFTRAPLDREIKKSEKKISSHRPAHFLLSFICQPGFVHISIGSTDKYWYWLPLMGKWQWIQGEGNRMLRA
jgi:hypothetical protein